MAYHYGMDDPLGKGPLFNAQGKVVTLTPWSYEGNVLSHGGCCESLCECLSDPCKPCKPCYEPCCDVLCSNTCAIPVSLIMCLFCTCCWPCSTCDDIPVVKSCVTDGRCPEGSLPSCCCGDSSAQEGKKDLPEHTYVYYSGSKTHGYSEEMLKTKSGKEFTVIFLENVPRSSFLENLDQALSSNHLIVFKRAEMDNWREVFSREKKQVGRTFEQSEQYQLGIQIEAKIKQVAASNAAKE